GVVCLKRPHRLRRVAGGARPRHRRAAAAVDDRLRQSRVGQRVFAGADDRQRALYDDGRAGSAGAAGPHRGRCVAARGRDHARYRRAGNDRGAPRAGAPAPARLSRSLPMNDAYILTLSCPDRIGIVHAVTGFLAERRANITEAAQYNDTATGLFFMRMRFDAAGTSVDELRRAFATLAEALAMSWALVAASERLPTVIMVSRLGHCLNDLLFRHRSGLLPLDIRAIVSNHRDFHQLAASYDIAFHHLPVSPETKEQAEPRLLEIIAAEKIELVVLA